MISTVNFSVNVLQNMGIFMYKNFMTISRLFCHMCLCLAKLPIDICLCERSEAISVYFDEIATHPMGRDDSDSVFLMAILGI